MSTVGKLRISWSDGRQDEDHAVNLNYWRRTVILLVAGLVNLLPRSGAADDSLIGKRVLTILSNVDIERDGRTIFRCHVGEPLTIVKEEGDRLYVGIGWINRRDVLPIDEAMRRFSQQVETAPTADHYYQRARGYLANDDVTQALLDAHECLIREPKHAEALALCGECWKRKSRLELAEMNVTDAISIKPQAAFYLLRGQVRLRQGMHKSAMEDFDIALQRDSSMPAAHMGRGLCLFYLEKYSEAKDEITQYLTVVGEDVEGYLGRAQCYIATREFDNAASDVTRCIQLEPKDASHYVKRGEISLAAEKYGAAADDFRMAIKLDPVVAGSHFYLGAALIKCNEHDAALRELDRALELDANLVNAHSIRALLWCKRKEYAKAMADLHDAVRIDPEDDASLMLRAWLFATAPDFAIRNGEQALKDAKKACELTNYANAERLKCLAASHAELGEFDEAVRWQKKAIEVNKDQEDKEELEEGLRLFEQKKPLRSD